MTGTTHVPKPDAELVSHFYDAPNHGTRSRNDTTAR